MEIYGDPKYSNKFFIYLDDGSIEWVKNLSVAKNYVSNSQFINWYNKPIFCTNEEIVITKDGKTYLKSQSPENLNKKTYDNKSLFITNAKQFIDNKLKELANEAGSESFYTLISWKDSNIKELKELAIIFLAYRDNVYNHFINILTKYDDIFSKTDELLNLSYIYDEFIETLPEFKNN